MEGLEQRQGCWQDWEGVQSMGESVDAGEEVENRLLRNEQVPFLPVVPSQYFVLTSLAYRYPHPHRYRLGGCPPHRRKALVCGLLRRESPPLWVRNPSPPLLKASLIPSPYSQAQPRRSLHPSRPRLSDFLRLLRKVTRSFLVARYDGRHRRGTAACFGRPCPAYVCFPQSLFPLELTFLNLVQPSSSRTPSRPTSTAPPSSTSATSPRRPPPSLSPSFSPLSSATSYSF